MGSAEGTVFEGRTLDAAVQSGLDALGLTRAEVIIQVIDEGASGFLGIGSRPYRVRVMPRPGGAIGERGEGRGNGRPRDGRRAVGRRGEAARGEPGGRRGRGPRSQRPASAASGRREAAKEPPAHREDRPPAAASRRREAAKESPAHEDHPAAEGRPAPLRRRGRRRSGAAADGPRDAGRTAAGGSRASASAPVTEEEATALAGTARRATEDLLAAMGFAAEVTARAEENRVEVTAQVPEGGDLVTGPKGEVRQALQHLLNRMINRGGPARYHLQLEINDFWHQREVELCALARSMADEAAAHQEEVVTEYLNAQERRVIHVTLRDDERVTTYALGEGMIKRLAVAPARAGDDAPGGDDQ